MCSQQWDVGCLLSFKPDNAQDKMWLEICMDHYITKLQKGKGFYRLSFTLRKANFFKQLKQSNVTFSISQITLHASLTQLQFRSKEGHCQVQEGQFYSHIVYLMFRTYDSSPHLSSNMRIAQVLNRNKPSVVPFHSNLCSFGNINSSKFLDVMPRNITNSKYQRIFIFAQN